MLTVQNVVQRLFNPMILAIAMVGVGGIVGCAVTETSTESSVTKRDVVAQEPSTASPNAINDSNPGSAQPKAKQDQEIPEHFHGEWNIDAKKCGPAAGEARLQIEAKQLTFYESVGVVQEIITEGDNKITVTVELTGEGETWRDSFDYELSQDQNTLTQVTDDKPFVRYRCEG